jgi:sugar O-acyltransferase (sialic acid O-acetyltransferase NeuD family)
MLTDELILFGAGGHSKSCIDVVELENIYKIVGLVGLPNQVGLRVLGYPIIAGDGATRRLATVHGNALVTIGQISSPDLRIKIFNDARDAGFLFPVIVSPRAQVSRHALIGAGTIVMHGAVVNAGAVIGENCILNTNAIVEHDAVIGDHCHISTGAAVNGGVCVGKGSFIGSCAVIREGLLIPERSFVKMGRQVVCSSSLRSDI